VKVDKTLVASIALHVLVIGWALVSFSARSLEAPPPESMPIDIISADQLSKITAGIKSGKKENPKPLVEKVAEAKPVEDDVGKIDEKKQVDTSSAPQPPPKPVEKPVEKKPDPPKPVTENKPKDEPKQVEKQPDRGSVEIGRGQEAEAETGSQGRASAAAEAEAGTGVRPDQDHSAPRQARSEPAIDHRQRTQRVSRPRLDTWPRGDVVAI
jgi:outer membrane biosynthesis protein TonB